MLNAGDLVQGQLLGFAVGLNDDDDGASRDDRIIWSGSGTIGDAPISVRSGFVEPANTPTPTPAGATPTKTTTATTTKPHANEHSDTDTAYPDALSHGDIYAHSNTAAHSGTDV